MNLSEEEKSIIIGSLLGDGHLERNGAHFRLQITHSIKQKIYLLWKMRKLKRLISGKIYIYRSSCRFRTKTLPIFDKFKRMFYVNGVKKVPSEIHSILEDKLALAVWFMDDGNIRKMGDKVYGYYLNTQSFSYKDNVNLVKAFYKVYGWKVLLLKNKNNLRLYIPGYYVEDFREKIKTHIIPSLRYKLWPRRD
jgi:hypothetical protein